MVTAFRLEQKVMQNGLESVEQVPLNLADGIRGLKVCPVVVICG